MTVVTTNLKANIQTEISALSGIVPAKALLKLAVASVGLNLNVSNLVARLNAAIAATDTNTQTADLIALNAAKLALNPLSVVGLNDTIMSTFQGDEFYNEYGHRFIKSGCFEDDVTGLDASVIKAAAYSEPFGSEHTTALPITNETYPLFISDTGVIIQVANGGDLYRQANENTPRIRMDNIYGDGAAYNINSIDTNHAGRWVIVCALGNTYLKYSDDDGLTWQNTNLRAKYSGKVYYSSVANKWVFIGKPSSSTAGDSVLSYSDDGITWTNSASALNTNSVFTVFKPNAADPHWYISSRSTASPTYYVYRSADNGQTWQLVITDNFGGIDNTEVKAIWSVNGRVFYYHYTGSFTRIVEAAIGHATYQTDQIHTYYAGANAANDDISIEINTIDERFFYHDNKVYFANGLVTSNGYTFSRQLEGKAAASPYMIKTPAGQMFFDHAGTDKVIRKAKPIAGVLTAYSEGASSQFVRIA